VYLGPHFSYQVLNYGVTRVKGLLKIVKMYAYKSVFGDGWLLSPHHTTCDCYVHITVVRWDSPRGTGLMMCTYTNGEADLSHKQEASREVESKLNLPFPLSQRSLCFPVPHKYSSKIALFKQSRLIRLQSE
jgi:hypothetical protein